MNDLGNADEITDNIHPVDGDLFAVTTDFLMREDTNSTGLPWAPDYQKVLDHVNVVCYLLICAFGLAGNGLVIFVVLMYSKMKRVTNMYILNLAISDVLFLTMLPITATTVLLKHWIFGLAVCKIYFVLCAINIFGGAFNLCVMSVDRYLAVCHPIQSLKYRTPRVALCLCLSVWLLSFLVMLPVILYTRTVDNRWLKGKYSCSIIWPEDQANRAFVCYTLILGFLIPVMFISVFYILIIVRLRRVGIVKKSKENRRSHGRVTRLIFTVITVYVVCWLPYWCFQVYGIFNSSRIMNTSQVLLINGFTVISYANSMLNPLLYAFLSDNFRQSFMKAFSCVSASGNDRFMCHDNGVVPCTSQSNNRSAAAKATIHEKMELSAMDNYSAVSQCPSSEKIYFKVHQSELGFLKPY